MSFINLIFSQQTIFADRAIFISIITILLIMKLFSLDEIFHISYKIFNKMSSPVCPGIKSLQNRISQKMRGFYVYLNLNSHDHLKLIISCVDDIEEPYFFGIYAATQAPSNIPWITFNIALIKSQKN